MQAIIILIIKLMQLQDKNFIDCISAKQLLQALNTLQKLDQPAQELQLSFSKSSQTYFHNDKNQNNINFQIYMAIKNNSKNTKQQKSHPIKQSKAQSKSAKNILKNAKQKTQNISCNQQKSIEISNLSATKRKSIQISHLKSKSHSPNVTKKTQAQRANHNSIALSTLYKPKNMRQKQNQPHPPQQNLSTLKISYNSKKIMMEREKKGMQYIPIYNRTNQLLKQKQEKIAKLQKINITQKQIQDRQCTFRPSINTYKRVNQNKQQISKNRHRNHTISDSVFDTVQVNQPEGNRLSILGEKSVGQIKQKIREQKVEKKEIMVKNMISKPQDKKQKQKPQNSKFNMLLDLIN